MIALTLSIIYLIWVGIIDYQVIFLFGQSWILSIATKLILIYLNSTGLGFLIGAIGLLRSKRWAKRLILTIVFLNLAYSLYVLYKDIIVEAIESYEYNRTLGGAPQSFIYLDIFLIFNLLFARSAWKKPLK